MTDSQPGDWERKQWAGIPKDLEGKVVSLEDLNASFPNYNIDVIRKGTDIWGEENEVLIYGDKDIKSSLAYKCPSCESIVIGPPKIEDHNTIALQGGSITYHAECKKCKNELLLVLIAMGP